MTHDSVQLLLEYIGLSRIEISNLYQAIGLKLFANNLFQLHTNSVSLMLCICNISICLKYRLVLTVDVVNDSESIVYKRT